MHATIALALSMLWIALAQAQAPAQQLKERLEDDHWWCATHFQRPIYAERGFALSMSGGGFRAMLYHVGALRRLNDAGMLAELEMVSSVSGGSITAGRLASAWKDLEFEPLDGGRRWKARNFSEVIEKPLMEFAAKGIDVAAVLRSLLPGASAADVIAGHYDALFGEAKLADLDGARSKEGSVPAPYFVFNATSLQTGELWQFRPTAMGGPSTGWIESDGVRLAQAVAASSAFPPFLSPMRIALPAGRWRDCSGFLLASEETVNALALAFHTGRSIVEPERLAEFRTVAVLTDGGVRDNLGLVAVVGVNRKRNEAGLRELDALASDAGRSYEVEHDPYDNWFGQIYRILGIATNEPDLLRIESLVLRALTREDTDDKVRARLCREDGAERRKWPRWKRDVCLKGDAAYWSSERHPPDHRSYAEPRPARLIEREHIRRLGRLPTRLHELSRERRERLVNWGYLSAHYALPFLGSLWQERDRLDAPAGCLPYRRDGGGAGFTDRPEDDDRLCPPAVR